MRLVLSALCVTFACSSVVHAGGLAFPEPNAAALGRAGTGAAIPNGPSAIYYNPAGLTLGHGLSIEAGVTIDHDRTALKLSGGARYLSASTAASPALFVGQRIGDHFAVGLGVFGAPSQSLEYPASFFGRFHVLRASFGGIELAPVVAGRPFSWLAVGFGLRVIFGQLDLAQAIGDTRYETRLRLTGSATGLGGTVGVWARLYRDYLTLGLAYKSAVDLDHSGQATSTAPGSDTPIGVDDMRLSLPMPHVFTFALGSRLRSGTSLELEARLGLLRDLDGFNANTASDPPAAILKLPLQLRELVQLRAGVEQRVLHDRLALRLGVGYDLGAARRDLDPALPDGDRVIVSAGLGYARPDFWIDAGYLAAFSPGTAGSRGIAYAADYAQVRHRIGLSLSVRVEAVGPRPKTFD